MVRRSRRVNTNYRRRTRVRRVAGVGETSTVSLRSVPSYRTGSSRSSGRSRILFQRGRRRTQAKIRFANADLRHPTRMQRIISGIRNIPRSGYGRVLGGLARGLALRQFQRQARQYMLRKATQEGLASIGHKAKLFTGAAQYAVPIIERAYKAYRARRSRLHMV